VIITGVALAVLLHRWTSDPRLGSVPESYDPRVVSEWREIDGSPTRFGRGSDSAPVTVVVFSDYLCPFCARATRSLEELCRQHPDQVRVVYRHLPLPADLSTTAAIVTERACRAERFPAVHRLLFENSDSIGLIPWSRLARRAGVAVTTGFMRCFEEEHPWEAVQEDRELASELGIRSTPTLLIDSLLIEGTPGLPFLDAYVRRARTLR